MIGQMFEILAAASYHHASVYRERESKTKTHHNIFIEYWKQLIICLLWLFKVIEMIKSKIARRAMGFHETVPKFGKNCTKSRTLVLTTSLIVEAQKWINCVFFCFVQVHIIRVLFWSTMYFWPNFIPAFFFSKKREKIAVVAALQRQP